MIKPTITCRLDTRELKRLRTKLAKEGGFVTVGVHADAGEYPDGTPVVKVAGVHEFGSEDGRVPERSYLRGTLNKKAGQDLMRAITRVVKSGKATEQVLGDLGRKLVYAIRERIARHIPPPLAASTVARKRAKGSPLPTTPLIDTGLLIKSIQAKVTTQPNAKPPSEG